MKKLVICSLLLAACASEVEPEEVAKKFDPIKSQLQADTFVSNLFPEVEINGPICMPEAVVEDMTQCSYSMKLEERWQVGTILCNDLGCRQGEAPAVVPDEMAVEATNNTSGGVSSGINNDWLLWYMLFSNGGTTHHYNSWYNNTPPAYRSAYYSRTYTPSSDAVNHYKTNYSAGVSAGATKRYPVKSSSSSTSRTAPKTSPISAPKVTPSPRPISMPAPSRSSGFGRSTRSSGSKN